MYLVKIDNWEKDLFDHVIVKNNVELIAVIKKISSEASITVTPVNGTVYQTAEFINE